MLSISEDIQYIWMGTNEGLYRYDKGTEILTTWSTNNSDLNEDFVRSVLVYQEDTYLCTDSSLYRLDTSTEQIIMVNDTIAGQLAIGNQGQLIIAGDMDYYEMMSEVVVYHQALSELIGLSCTICETTTDVEVFENGDVWISHYSFYVYDLLSFDGENWMVYNIQVEPEIFPIESWSDNKLDSKDNSLLSTSWGGLVSYDGAQWEVIDQYSDPQVIVGSDTLRLGHTGVAFDQNEGYWFGTISDYQNNAPGKLAYFNETSWSIIELPLDSSFSVIDIVASDQISSYIYIGTSGGLLILDKNCLGLPNGISEYSSESLGVFPNPTSGTIRFSEPLSGMFSIYDLRGKLIYSRQLNSDSELDISDIKPGVHSCTLLNNGKLNTFIFIAE